MIGIDEWAWRGGNRFGTLICDLERHRVIALLADREATSVAQWLRSHPTIEVVCRDRSGLFADGIRQGAPHATQVRDRFHLVTNLRDALERFFLRHRHWFAAAKPSHMPVASTLHHQRQEHTSARWYRVQALRKPGTSIAAIARHLHISRPTVYRYLALSCPPERRHRRHHTQADGALVCSLHPPAMECRMP